MGRSWRCDYWISYVHYSQCDWVDTRLVIRYSNRSKGQCTNHLICFDQIKGLAVGAIRRYPLKGRGSQGGPWVQTNFISLYASEELCPNQLNPYPQ